MTEQVRLRPELAYCCMQLEPVSDRFTREDDSIDVIEIRFIALLLLLLNGHEPLTVFWPYNFGRKIFDELAV